MVEFISYDGKYPCLCMGTLTIKVNGKTYWLNNKMISGGCIMRDGDWNMWSENGDWEIDLEKYPELEPYKEEITQVVNDNVEQGCCGGCI